MPIDSQGDESKKHRIHEFGYSLIRAALIFRNDPLHACEISRRWENDVAQRMGFSLWIRALLTTYRERSIDWSYHAYTHFSRKDRLQFTQINGKLRSDRIVHPRGLQMRYARSERCERSEKQRERERGGREAGDRFVSFSIMSNGYT